MALILIWIGDFSKVIYIHPKGMFQKHDYLHPQMQCMWTNIYPT
jgi:hypothetical protein